VLSVISLVYIGIVFLLIKETKVCPEIVKSANMFTGFWDEYLGCRSVNELGDTLAGAFAPVAFLWLMGAVFIQSQELKAQREELDETQEVMQAQLEVARQQVEETKASTALFKTQTDLMRSESQLRIQDEKIEATLVYITRLLLHSDLYGACKKLNSTDKKWHPVPIVAKVDSNTKIEEIFDKARMTIERIIFQHDNPSFETYSVSHEWLELIKEHINFVLLSEQKISGSKKIRIMSLFLEPLVEQIAILIKKVPQIEVAHQRFNI